MRGRLHAASTFALSLWCHVARAQSASIDADALVREGVELRREGRDEKALEDFERAYAFDPSPRVRAQIGLAQQALGRWVDAERSLSEALAARDDAWIAKNRAALEAAVATIQKHLAWLEVVATPPDAELEINGAPAPGAGAAARVIAGVVVVDVRANGYVPVRRTLDIAAGSRAREVVDLVRVAAAPHESQGPTRVGSAKGRPGEGPESRSRAAAWITAGAAAALAGGGAIAVVVRENNAAVYNDDGRCFYGNMTREQRCGEYRSTALTAQWLAVGAFAAAVVTGGVSAWLFLSDSTSTQPRTARLRCGPAAGAVGVACGGTF